MRGTAMTISKTSDRSTYGHIHQTLDEAAVLSEARKFAESVRAAVAPAVK